MNPISLEEKTRELNGVHGCPCDRGLKLTSKFELVSCRVRLAIKDISERVEEID